MIITALQTLTLTLFLKVDASSIADGAEAFIYCTALSAAFTYAYIIPDMADIALETIEYDGKISGRVDFIGMQKNETYPYWPGRSYKNTKTNNIDGNRNILLLFMKKLDAPLRKKIHVTQSFSRYSGFHSCLTPWRSGHYEQILDHQKSVNDSLSCVKLGRVKYKYKKDANDGLTLRLGTYVNPDNTRRSKGRMVSHVLARIKKHSKADYFLLIALAPLEYSPHKKTAKVALLTIVYNRAGKKIYSRIYEESLDDTEPFGDHFLYDCTMKLIEKQGEQISKDLSFLLAPDDAPVPTLEDLYNRLQQPGRIEDDTRFLKEFQKK
ncbi:MAG: hypothetical protein FWG13_01055 [Leptospirales bacterium]|nr:hypothetical protein [Leptospirales bacterium]